MPRRNRVAAQVIRLFASAISINARIDFLIFKAGDTIYASNKAHHEAAVLLMRRYEPFDDKSRRSPLHAIYPRPALEMSDNLISIWHCLMMPAL